ncbi:MAG: hypothetical protein NC489_35070 [Ruminococcus flavefaciens]|nr:hypothetical protein [Ruminococcus flavefaciens]
MRKETKLVVVGIFFDGYEELWYDFFNLFFKNWKDCPFDLYVVNNMKDIHEDYDYKDKIHVIHAGADAEYSRKLRVALEQIQADYYLFLLEDFFICKKIENEVVEKILFMVTEDQLDYYEMPLPEFHSYTGELYKKNEKIYHIGSDRKTLFSCQPAIWRREFLRFILGNEDYNFNAWIFEGSFVASNFLRNPNLLAYAAYDKRNPLEMVHGAYQGKILKDAIIKTRYCGYELINSFPKMGRKLLFCYKMKRAILELLKCFHLSKLKKLYKGSKYSVTNRYREQSEKIAQKLYSEARVGQYILEKRGENI